MAVGKCLINCFKSREEIDFAHLGGFDQASETVPILAPLVLTGEEGILAIWWRKSNAWYRVWTLKMCL